MAAHPMVELDEVAIEVVSTLMADGFSADLAETVVRQNQRPGQGQEFTDLYSDCLRLCKGKERKSRGASKTGDAPAKQAMAGEYGPAPSGEVGSIPTLRSKRLQAVSKIPGKTRKAAVSPSPRPRAREGESMPKKCACGCGTDIESERFDYVRGHKKASKKNKSAGKEDAQHDRSLNGRSPALRQASVAQVSEYDLDRHWARLPFETKMALLFAREGAG